MAFKMKGSAFKLNEVATKSALKHSGTDKSALPQDEKTAKGKEDDKINQKPDLARMEKVKYKKEIRTKGKMTKTECPSKKMTKTVGPRYR